MTCGDCRYFDTERADWGYCRFPERTFPDWFISRLHDEHVDTHYFKHNSDGVDCPALSPAPTGDK